MKLVVVKKGTKRWLPEERASGQAACCTMIEALYWSCSKVAAA